MWLYCCIVIVCEGVCACIVCDTVLGVGIFFSLFAWCMNSTFAYLSTAHCELS
jgi:hypothetical protein